MSDEHNIVGDTSTALVFYHHVGKLKDLASVSLMAALMHHKITQMHRGNVEVNIDSREVDLIGVPLPETIKNLISGLSHKMNECRVKWWKYHWEQVFFHNMPSNDMITLLDQLIWLPDGSISFEQTARKLLNSDKCTEVQKFQLACTYCFIDDVNRLKETLSQDEADLATKNFHTNDPFLDYWRVRFAPCTNGSPNPKANLFDFVLAISNHFYLWPALEYFWNQSHGEEERLIRANRIIDYHEAELICHLLPKLTSSELDSMLREKCRVIIAALMEDEEPNYNEYALLIWKRAVNIINDDSLLSILRETRKDFLWEMWLSISERQKMFVANQRNYDFVEDLIEGLTSDSPNYELIVDIFSLWDVERRRQFWDVNWLRLVIGQMCYKNRIEEMMKLCLESEEKIAVFKSAIMIDYNTIRAACKTLLCSGRFEELQTYLNFCTSDQEVIRNLKKKIITKMSKRALFELLWDHCDERVEIEFENHLHEVLTASEAKDFKNQLVMCNLELMHSKLDFELVRDVVLFVEKYLSSEEDLIKVKLDFIDYSRELNSDYGSGTPMEFNMQSWLDLLAWCFNSEKSLVEQFNTLLRSSAKVSDNVKTKRRNYNDRRRTHCPNSIFRSFCDLYLQVNR